MPKKIDDELKVRAVRLVNDHQGEYSASGQALTVVVPTMATAKAHANDAGNQSRVSVGRSASKCERCSRLRSRHTARCADAVASALDGGVPAVDEVVPAGDE